MKSDAIKSTLQKFKKKSKKSDMKIFREKLELYIIESIIANHS